MRDTIIEILEDLIPDFDETETRIIDKGILSSLSTLQLIVRLNEEFDISIPAADIKPANFNSVDAILTLINRLHNED